MTGFDPSVEELTSQVEFELARFLDERRSLEEAIPMINEIARLLEAGGKRLRPAFCFWGYRASGGDDDASAMKAAASLELLHTFAIVHDDIMDSSDERRGSPTTYAALGVDVALLVGDLALVLADEAFMRSGFSPAALTSAFDCYSRMRQQVIAGQYLDVVVSDRNDVSVEVARRIAVLKSGRYSIEEPLLIGAALAGASDELSSGLARFGAPLGEAFQLRDDLLGTFGDRSSIGKPVDSDIREGKRHVLYAKTIELLGETGGDFAARWGGGAALTDEDVKELREVIDASGARAATEDLLMTLRGEAVDALARLPIDEGSRAALAELARRATERSL
ncbi:MAG: polyprenyl synthetase family protein [Actinomycetota bacterium]